jgi:hypothetical protein
MVTKFLDALLGKLRRNKLLEDPKGEVAYQSLLAPFHQPVLKRAFQPPPPLFTFLS